MARFPVTVSTLLVEALQTMPATSTVTPERRHCAGENRIDVPRARRCRRPPASTTSPPPARPPAATPIRLTEAAFSQFRHAHAMTDKGHSGSAFHADGQVNHCGLG